MSKHLNCKLKQSKKENIKDVKFKKTWDKCFQSITNMEYKVLLIEEMMGVWQMKLIIKTS
jgi:hypothetical protein